MRPFYLTLLSIIAFAIVSSCEESSNIDKQKPLIENNFTSAFPQNCDTLYFGESFDLKLLFSDNFELGSYSIDIHHNFDGHSHSTEVSSCNHDVEKEPVNPLTFISDYTIPEGLNEYETNTTINTPGKNGNGFYDEGDYHFFVSLTDATGWSTQMGLSIKMIYR